MCNSLWDSFYSYVHFADIPYDTIVFIVNIFLNGYSSWVLNALKFVSTGWNNTYCYFIYIETVISAMVKEIKISYDNHQPFVFDTMMLFNIMEITNISTL